MASRIHRPFIKVARAYSLYLVSLDIYRISIEKPPKRQHIWLMKIMNCCLEIREQYSS